MTFTKAVQHVVVLACLLPLLTASVAATNDICTERADVMHIVRDIRGYGPAPDGEPLEAELARRFGARFGLASADFAQLLKCP
jgi:hypothetical protein